jgi:monoamine oxidase
MQTTTTDILIIGAGLTGLATAYYLKDKNLKVQILEAKDRPGGRIHTLYKNQQAPIELGATWLGKKHHHLNALLRELKIGVFEQLLGDRAIYEPISTSPPQIVQLPPNSDPSFRIQGGTSTLIQALYNQLEADQVHFEQVVQAIAVKTDHVGVTTHQRTFQASIVISTLPPFLLTQTVAIQPGLPEDLLQIARQTHTWMGDSIKVGLSYQQPFWRESGTSGTIFSNVGPIPEMYDHANYQDNLFALKGFLNSAYHSITIEERRELVLQQLRKYFGKTVENYLTYEEAIWRNDPFTFVPYPTHILPHQNNGHSIFRLPCLDGKFYIAGSETAATFPGYMDGAVESAKFVSSIILENLNV